MASRLINGDDAVEVQALIWPGANNSAGQRSAATFNSSNTPAERPEQVLMGQQARIQQLERELDARPKQAYEQGFNEGQAKGMEQANRRLDPVMAQLAHSLQELSSVRKQRLVEAEQDAVRLAIAVARRVLHRELSVDPESLLGIVKAAIERVDARDVHRIRLHADDVPVLNRHLAATGMPPRVELVADASLERGSVIIDSSRGSLDASISSQLMEIERGLVDLVRRSS